MTDESNEDISYRKRFASSEKDAAVIKPAPSLRMRVSLRARKKNSNMNIEDFFKLCSLLCVKDELNRAPTRKDLLKPADISSIDLPSQIDFN